MRLKRTLWMRILLLLIILIIVSMIIIGVFENYIWIIVDLMIIFLIIPMITTFLYINDALSPGAFFNTLPHTIEVKDRKILIHIEIQPKSETSDLSENAIEPKPTDVRLLEFPCSDIEPYYAGLTNITLPIRQKGIDGLILLPVKAFKNQDNLIQFLNEIYDNTDRKEK